MYIKPYKNYILARTYYSSHLIKRFVVSSLLVLTYVLIVGSVIIGAIIWYVNKKLSDNVDRIVRELEKIEGGNLENLTIQTNILEFDELIARINQLLKSLRLSWNKFSAVIDKGRFPIGIYEENYFYKKVFISERLLEILGFSGEDMESGRVSETGVREILEGSENIRLMMKISFSSLTETGRQYTFVWRWRRMIKALRIL